MAITSTVIFHTVMGDRAVGVYRFRGFDGTANGVSVPFGTIDAAFKCEGLGASVTMTGCTIGWSNRNIDFSGSLGTGNEMYVMIIGTN